MFRKHLNGLQPYVSARSLVQEDNLICLDANENPNNNIDLIDLSSIELNRYPDPGHDELREKIVVTFGTPVSANNLCLFT